MARPDWMPTDSGGLVAALIATGESCGVELLRAVAEELVTGKPSELLQDAVCGKNLEPADGQTIGGKMIGEPN